MNYNVLITGGTRGIGLEIVKKFIKDRNCGNIYIIARLSSKGDPVLRNSIKVKLIVYDLGERIDIRLLPKEPIKYLINNAGSIYAQPPGKIDTASVFYFKDRIKAPGMLRNIPAGLGDLLASDDSQKRYWNLNYQAYVDLMGWYVEKLRGPKPLSSWNKKDRETSLNYGRIINIASLAGHRACDYYTYASLKAAVISLTKSFAVLFQKYVTAVSISPGYVNTKLMDRLPLPKSIVDRIPLHRQAEPSEIADLVFAIKDLHYLNGVDIVMDGGLSAKE